MFKQVKTEDGECWAIVLPPGDLLKSVNKIELHIHLSANEVSAVIGDYNIMCDNSKVKVTHK